MSADNGIYVLRTPTDDGYEYRVQHLQAIDNLEWDRGDEAYSDDPAIWIENARAMWRGCHAFTREGEALEYAAELLRQQPICEYGISFIDIDRRF